MQLGLEKTKVLIVPFDPSVALEIARSFADEKADVVVASADLNSYGAIAEIPGVRFVNVDAGSEDGCKELLEALPAIDVLIHDASENEPKDFQDTTAADWTLSYEQDVLSAVRLTQAYLPGMLERDRGRVLLITSATALMSTPDLVHAAAPKAARLALVHALAVLTKGSAVTVNTVLTGALRSGSVADELVGVRISTRVPPAAAEKLFINRRIPSALLHRLIEPSELASLLLFYASPLSGATNGAILRVDGGAAAGIT